MTASKGVRELTRDRDRRAAELRAAGMMWREIAVELGMGSFQAASQAAKRHQERHAAQMEAAE